MCLVEKPDTNLAHCTLSFIQGYGTSKINLGMQKKKWEQWLLRGGLRWGGVLTKKRSEETFWKEGSVWFFLLQFQTQGVSICQNLLMAYLRLVHFIAHRFYHKEEPKTYCTPVNNSQAETFKVKCKLHIYNLPWNI